MKRILCSLLVATLPFGSVLADAPKSILRSSRSGDECRDVAIAADDDRTHEPSPAFEPSPQHTVHS